MKSHEETLRLLAGIYESKAQRMGFSNSEHAAACLAGADALRRGTCANCVDRIDWPDAIGCGNTRGLNRDEVSPDDFCSQWAPRLPDAPTEPTR